MYILIVCGASIIMILAGTLFSEAALSVCQYFAEQAEHNVGRANWVLRLLIITLTAIGVTCIVIPLWRYLTARGLLH